MQCEYCHSETRSRMVKKQPWLNGRLYIVENVCAEVCPECGTRYYHARTLDEVDRVIRADHPVKEVLSVEVLSV